MTAPHAASVDAATPTAERLLTETSLPSAGFRVCRLCDLCCAIGMFTTHRAEPSWT